MKKRKGRNSTFHDIFGDQKLFEVSKKHRGEKITYCKTLPMNKTS